MKIIGGYTNYGQDIGILMLDTRFPRIIGDIGNANTFHTHVRYRTVRNITKGPITEKNIEKELLFPFLEAAKVWRPRAARPSPRAAAFWRAISSGWQMLSTFRYLPLRFCLFRCCAPC